MAGDMAADAVT